MWFVYDFGEGSTPRFAVSDQPNYRGMQPVGTFASQEAAQLRATFWSQNPANAPGSTTTGVNTGVDANGEPTATDQAIYTPTDGQTYGQGEAAVDAGLQSYGEDQTRAAERARQKAALAAEAFERQKNTDFETLGPGYTGQGATNKYGNIDPSQFDVTPPGGVNEQGIWDPGIPNDPGALQTGDNPYAGTYMENFAGATTLNPELMTDPGFMVDAYLNAQGLGQSSNRGTLEQAFGSYGSLYDIQNPGLTGLSPAELATQAGNFTGGMMQNAGSAPYVDPRTMYDQMFNPAYTGQGGVGAATPNAAEFELGKIMQGITAMTPWMGEQNANQVKVMVQQAYYDYMQNGSLDASGMSFTQYLDSIGARGWF